MFSYLLRRYSFLFYRGKIRKNHGPTKRLPQIMPKKPPPCPSSPPAALPREKPSTLRKPPPRKPFHPAIGKPSRKAPYNRKTLLPCESHFRAHICARQEPVKNPPSALQAPPHPQKKAPPGKPVIQASVRRFVIAM